MRVRSRRGFPMTAASQVRVFSYLPNPRVWKATIAARIGGVEIDLRGAPAADLAEWLWDFDARPGSEAPPVQLRVAEHQGRVGFKGEKLYKTDAFLEADPLEPCRWRSAAMAWWGLLESNSIMRTVARLSPTAALYGRDAFEASRIDSFLDVSLVFGWDAQTYLPATHAGSISPDIYTRADEAFTTYMGGHEQALTPPRDYLVGNGVSLADICFACEIALFHNELPRASVLAEIGQQPFLATARERFPRAMAHFEKLAADPDFAPEFAPYLDKFRT